MIGQSRSNTSFPHCELFAVVLLSIRSFAMSFSRICVEGIDQNAPAAAMLLSKEDSSFFRMHDFFGNSIVRDHIYLKGV